MRSLLPGRRPSAVERHGRPAVVPDHHLPVPHPGQGGRHERGRAARDGSYLLRQGGRIPEAGAVHFHAVFRLDAATGCVCPACLLPPPEEFSAALLEQAVKEAAATVAVVCPVVDEGQGVTLMARWGEQLHVRHLIRDDGEDDKRLSAEQVAGYVAKYATKATEALGVTLDHRIGEVELETWTYRPMWLSWSGHAGSWGAVRAWWGCGCGSGRTCWASAATSRPRAAATRPPWVPCGGPESSMPSAGAVATP
jgi:hypothetical protein